MPKTEAKAESEAEVEHVSHNVCTFAGIRPKAHKELLKEIDAIKEKMRNVRPANKRVTVLDGLNGSVR